MPAHNFYLFFHKFNQRVCNQRNKKTNHKGKEKMNHLWQHKDNQQHQRNG